MNHVVFVWEMGNNLGHLLRLLPIALELRRRGHQVSFCLKDLSRAAPFLDQHQIRYYQSPVWRIVASGMPPMRSYADIMLHNGFLEADTLAGPVAGWRNLFQLLKPDLLILDHAPTALVASLGLGIPRALLGSGFCIPPTVDPLPAFNLQEKTTAGGLQQTSQRALQSINTLLKSKGIPQLEQLSDLFKTEETFLCTLPELDHYPQRPAATYWGPLFNTEEGIEPVWPYAENADKRVFAYLYPEKPCFKPLMETLARLPVTTLVYAPGLSTSHMKRMQSARLKFSSKPLNMGLVQKHADLIICHGSFGTVCAALMAGKPLLMLPSQAEQTIFSRRVEKQGFGLMIGKEQKNPNYKKQCRLLLEDASFTEKAAEFANRYVSQTTEKRIAAISDRCEQLATQG